MDIFRRLAGGFLVFILFMTSKGAEAQEISWVPVYTNDASRHRAGTLEFDIVNRGRKELIVDRIRAACSCSRTYLATNAVGPGLSGRLRVWLREDAERSGKPSSVYVFSNDPVNPVICIPVDPKNRAGFKCEPARILFKFSRGIYEPAQQSIQISQQVGLPITVLKVRNPCPYITIPEKSFACMQSNVCVTIIADAGMFPRESQSKIIEIICSYGKDVVSLKIPLDIVVDGAAAVEKKVCLSCINGTGTEIAVAPDVLQLSRKEADDGCDKTIRIVVAENMPIVGLEMQTWGGQISSESHFPKQMLPGERADCKVRIKAGAVFDSGTCSAICIRGVVGDRRVFKVIPVYMNR